MFFNLPVKHVQSHRHLDLTLDSQLNFNSHISSTLSIVNKLTALLPKLLIFREPWHKKLESAQYNVALAITGAIRGTNTVKLYPELGLESLRNRRKLRRFNLFCKICNDQSPLNLYNLVPAKTLAKSQRNPNNKVET